MSDKRTISVYDQRADEYADKLALDRPYPRLEAFIDVMPVGGHVLDLGCGPGSSAARMVARGLVVDALDASESMARLAHERYGLTVRVATFDDVSAEHLYDGVWAHFSLLHAPRDAFSRHLAALQNALKPGGRLLLAMKLGSGEKRDSLDRHYTYYSEQELERLLNGAGFDVLEREFGEDAGLAGSLDSWIILHATSR